MDEVKQKLKKFVEFWKKEIQKERQAQINFHLQELLKWWGEREKLKRAIRWVKGKILQQMDDVVLVRFGSDKLLQTEIREGDVVLVLPPNVYSQLKKIGNLQKAYQFLQNYPLGNVVNVGKHFVEVWLYKPLPWWLTSQKVDLQLFVNDITFKRQEEALEYLLKLKGAKREQLAKILLGEPLKITLPQSKSLDSVKFKLNLNHIQKRFVAQALGDSPVWLLHWPFWTGKTTTLTELIFQLTQEGKKVLVTADSNTAADNFLLKFEQTWILKPKEAVRVGPVASIWWSELRKYSLYVVAQDHPKYPLLNQLEIEIQKIKKQQSVFLKPVPALRRWLSDMQIHRLAAAGKPYRGLKIKQIQSMSNWLHLQKRIDKLVEQKEELREKIYSEILDQAKVVVTTNSWAWVPTLQSVWFDVAVIDEGSQATLPSALIPIVSASRFVIGGDHRQLPPVVLAQDAKELQISLFERLIKNAEAGKLPPQVKTMLEIQYRMNETLMEFPSKMFYEGKLKAAPEVKDITLADLVGKKQEGVLDSQKVVYFLDVQGKQVLEGKTQSYFNEDEIELVKWVVKVLLDWGLQPKQIGVITPYAAQKSLLAKALGEVEVNTVDGFQGREKEVIVISWVRTEGVGFLTDHRRFNVAITRAKRMLINIGDSKNLRQLEIFEKYLKWVGLSR